MTNDNSNDHLLGSFAIFTVLLILSTTMLLIALLLWFAQLIGSLIGALLIIGGSAAIVSLIIYNNSVRPGMQRLRDELSTIYEVANFARTGYRWVVECVTLLRRQ